MYKFLFLFLFTFLSFPALSDGHSSGENFYKLQTSYHTLVFEKFDLSKQLNSAYERKFKPLGYMVFEDQDILLFSGEGKIFKINKSFDKKPKKIISNLSKIIETQNYTDVRSSIKDAHKVLINDKEYVLISYLKEVSNTNNVGCYNLSILYADINKLHNFSNFFTYDECINYPFNPHAAGGRIKTYDDKSILFTIGDLLTNDPAQNPKSNFGKILKIELNEKTSTIFSMGHRNPQGLFIDDSKNVYSTEHGPQGGDEVNLILEGENYGWPLVSYGTGYGFKDKEFALNAYYVQDSHLEYFEPMYAFVPSIGISEIVKYEKNYFDNWKNDLIVASLGGKNHNYIKDDNTVTEHRGMSLYRMRLSKDNPNKIVNIERIFIGDRIRDVLIDDDGLIYLVTEKPEIIKITR